MHYNVFCDRKGISLFSACLFSPGLCALRCASLEQGLQRNAFDIGRLCPAMSSLDEIQSLINSAKDELAESRKLKEQVEHETVQVGC